RTGAQQRAAARHARPGRATRAVPGCQDASRSPDRAPGGEGHPARRDDRGGPCARAPPRCSSGRARRRTTAAATPTGYRRRPPMIGPAIFVRGRLSSSSGVTAFQHPNYRLFFSGQLISLVGTWMQQVAQAWLVLTLTGDPIWLGIVATAQFLPVMILGLFAGVVADAFPKR